MAELADVSPWLIVPSVVVLWALVGAMTAGYATRRGLVRVHGDDVVMGVLWPVFWVVRLPYVVLAPMCRALYRITSGSGR